MQTGNRKVAVTAYAEDEMIDITGNFQTPGVGLNANKSWKPSIQGPGLGTSGGAQGIGGAVMVQLDFDNVTAKIENGVTLYGDTLDVEGYTKNITINLTASGGKAKSFGLNDAMDFSAAIDTTLAQIDSGANIIVGAGHVSASYLTLPSNTPSSFVGADDMTTMVTIAGSIAMSDKTAVGLSAGGNLVGRSTQAVIGAIEGESAATTLGSFTSGGAVDINATNEGFVGAFAIAGTKSTNNPAQANGGSGATNNPGTGGTRAPTARPRATRTSARGKARWAPSCRRWRERAS